MSYRIDPPAPTAAEVRRIALEQLDRARAELGEPELDRHEAVHQVRKRCKKLRALLRLCRGAIGKDYRRENVRYRDAARPLSGLRDAEALIEAYDRLMDRYEGPLERQDFAPVRRQLTLQKQHRAEVETDLDARLETFASEIEAGRERLDKWTRRIDGLGDCLSGFRKNYRRGRKAMKAALSQPSTERFHEWRKRTKYLGFHLKLLEKVWKPVMRAHRKEAEHLADLLGREHDFAVFQAHLEKEFADYGNREVMTILSGLIHERREELRRKAALCGRRLFAEKPDEITGRLQRLLDT
ncbi:CHAD domain-containing protein [Haloferula sp. A504]|uniref:CHAD domain-containing protein n=1 Tax=Haloferula sp. A504 TaxID=3373601 RepID=UPI0031BED470|nr:CHAD domain-containing protein [Verrucomicrobiaceae bacterium E54]